MSVRDGKVRRPTHAQSWYSASGSELNEQLGDWLSQAHSNPAPARAIIAPHAGYFYCGACSAYAYKQIDPARTKRIFILGPSHHIRLSGCALSSAERYQTPLYDLIIDSNIYDELYRTHMFEPMSLCTDEDEHSIEMHLPYIAKVMSSHKDSFTIVPVLVGSLTPEKEQAYGRIFSRYLSDPENLLIISSDFCHWGQRFRYTYFDQTYGEIWKSIEDLDRKAMDIIEAMDPEAFTEYLKKYQNTICGRHPISILLNAIFTLKQHGNGHSYSMKFTKYSQSSQCITMKDSSVSYAAAALTINK